MPVTCFAGRSVTVLGLGRSGRAAARALLEGGADVEAFDDSSAARDAAAALGIAVVGEAADLDLTGKAALVASPGVPFTHPEPHPVIARAQKAGVPVMGDVDLFRRSFPDATLLGVTGTNGKSTTATLIGHLLRAAGKAVQVGGNIGRPSLDLDPPAAGSVVLLELSSYQLDLSEALACKVAVWLNLSPDHLDRHGDIEGYAAAKRWVFEGQGPDDTAVIGVDDRWGEAEVARLCGLRNGPRVVPVSADRVPSGGVGVQGGIIQDALEGPARAIAPVPAVPSLRGRHNAQNVAAAYAAVRALGVPADAIVAGLGSFEGLPHRMEPVGEIDGIAFVNDSKATNPDAAATSLVCYDDVYWIAGGRPKPGGFGAIEPHLGRIRKAFLIGEAAGELERFLGGRVPHVVSGDLATALDQALAVAREDALPGAVVLLVPACASFDQFTDFEARGDSFRRLVADRRPREHGS